MKIRKLYLSLGSNSGDRSVYLEKASGKLDMAFGPRIWESKTIETEAIGFCGGNFLNKIMEYNCHKRAETVLRICKSIERDLGRTEKPEYDQKGERIYHDRTIDIDILIYGEMKMDTPLLIIPHPQLYSRPFVKELLDSEML